MNQRSDKVLVAGQTIALSPMLARAIGLEEALVLQQLFFRMRWGSSDPQRRWICAEHHERIYVGWNDRGREEDLLLSKYPYRRVLSNLRSLGLVHEAQHLEQPFDQRLFLSIDFVGLRTICPECRFSIVANSDMDVSLKDCSKQELRSQSLSKRDREKERERESNLSLEFLMSKVTALAGTGPKDNRDRDKKCADRIRQMVESGEVTLEDFAQIVQSPHVKFPSEIEAALTRRAKVAAEHLASVAREEASAAEQHCEQRTRALEQQQAARAKQFLAYCSDSTLHTIAEEIRQLNAAPALAARAVAAVAAREVGHIPARELVIRVLTPRLTGHVSPPFNLHISACNEVNAPGA